MRPKHKQASPTNIQETLSLTALGVSRRSSLCDSTVNSTFSGLVDISHITSWHIESEINSFTSNSLVDQPDSTGLIPIRFRLNSGAITRWDLAHRLGTSSNYEIYTLGNSFVVGPGGGATEDGSVESLGAGVNHFITNNPGSWNALTGPLAMVVSTNSDAFVVNTSGSTVATPNLRLNVGDTLTTGANGASTLFLTNGADTAELTLAANTSLGISDLLALVVDETVGFIDHAVHCETPGSVCFRLRVRPPVPVAIVGIRGTKFSIFSDGAGGSILNVREGVVEASDSSGQFRLVPAGQSIALGSAPVPTPAALWLFGSALIGGLGFTRRRIANCVS